MVFQKKKSFTNCPESEASAIVWVVMKIVKKGEYLHLVLK